MDNQIVEKIKKKKKYNELLFKITQYNLHSLNPPDKLIKEAKELGRQLEIPETEYAILNLQSF